MLICCLVLEAQEVPHMYMFIITYKNVLPIQCLPITGSGQCLSPDATLYNNSSSSARTIEVELKYKSINQTQQWTDQLHSTQMNLEKNQWANQRDKELKPHLRRVAGGRCHYPVADEGAGQKR